MNFILIKSVHLKHTEHKKYTCMLVKFIWWLTCDI